MKQKAENKYYITPSNSFNGNAERSKEKNLFWVPDEEVSQCPSCNVNFSVRIRKHHCRACGNVFCSNCSDNRIKISAYMCAEKVRVCDQCFLERSTTQSILLQEDLGVRKQINRDLKKALAEKMEILERFKTFLLEFESEIINNGNFIITSTDVTENNNTIICSNSNFKNSGWNTNDSVDTQLDGEPSSINTNTTIIPTSKNIENISDHKEMIMLLKKGEYGIKLLNERIKNYNIIIEKQKNELKELKKEKEQKEELTKLLKKRNFEIQQKNQNISNLLMEKNKLVSLKTEYEYIIDTHKKQIERLITRCNTLEVQINENMNKKYLKKWKLRDHVKNYKRTGIPFTHEETSYWNSFQTSGTDIFMAYTVAEGIDAVEENDSCCKRCQRKLCHFM